MISPIISIIIPAYNVADCIDRCLESIIKQTYKEIEIIIVNDGSTDATGNICDAYSEKYNYISVIHQQNKGVSASRNIGIRRAKGKYIAFIDSDDYVEANYLENMIIIAIASQCDLIVSGIELEYDNATKKVLKIDRCDFEISNAELFHQLIQSRLCYGPCNKLYIASIIKDNNIEFPDDISYGEDRVFNYKYLQHVKYISLSDNIAYNYVIHSDGSLSSRRYHNLFDIEYAQWSMLYNLYKSKNVLTEEAKRALFVELFWMVNDNIMNNRNLPIFKQYKYLKKVLSISDLDGISEFLSDIKCNSIIKRLILHRRYIIMVILLMIMNICKK